MATTSNESDSPRKTKGNEENDDKDDQSNILQCNICSENAFDPVVSVCGHLYCWPCLHQCLETQRGRKVCIVCKFVINIDKLVPIYGRGNCKQEDPRKERKKVPPRPTGLRTEPGISDFLGLTFEDGQLLFGIGIFPFRLLTLLNFTDRSLEIPVGDQLQEDDQILSNFFLWLAVLFNILLLLL